MYTFTSVFCLPPNVYNYHHEHPSFSVSMQAEWRESGAFVHAGQELGWLRPVVGQEYSLEDANRAHEEVTEHRAGTKGKVVLKVR